MTISWLIFDVASAARHLARAVDADLGYPRNHAANDPGIRIGARVTTQDRTETHCPIMRQRSTGQIAVGIDDIVRGLAGRIVELADSGVPRNVTITLSGVGITEVALLPGRATGAADAGSWEPRPARDGMAVRT